MKNEQTLAIFQLSVHAENIVKELCEKATEYFPDEIDARAAIMSTLTAMVSYFIKTDENENHRKIRALAFIVGLNNLLEEVDNTEENK